MWFLYCAFSIVYFVVFLFSLDSFAVLLICSSKMTFIIESIPSFNARVMSFGEKGDFWFALVGNLCRIRMVCFHIDRCIYLDVVIFIIDSYTQEEYFSYFLTCCF